jgi:hypothetical protein
MLSADPDIRRFWRNVRIDCFSSINMAYWDYTSSDSTGASVIESRGSDERLRLPPLIPDECSWAKMGLADGTHLCQSAFRAKLACVCG